MEISAGDTVRFNVKEEAEYGYTGTVQSVTTSPIDGRVILWVNMPQGGIWTYRPDELELVTKNA